MPRARTDLSVAWECGEPEPFFDLLETEAEARGLSFLFIDDTNVRKVLRRLEAGRLGIGFHLDSSAFRFRHSRAGSMDGSCRARQNVECALPPGVDYYFRHRLIGFHIGLLSMILIAW